SRRTSPTCSTSSGSTRAPSSPVGSSRAEIREGLRVCADVAPQGRRLGCRSNDGPHALPGRTEAADHRLGADPPAGGAGGRVAAPARSGRRGAVPRVDVLGGTGAPAQPVRGLERGGGADRVRELAGSADVPGGRRRPADARLTRAASAWPGPESAALAH